ncbi:hypothetical protein N9Y92_01965 [Chlamydiales bacterium]|nr:hypothetical protein [Chlamydiales bacterium]
MSIVNFSQPLEKKRASVGFGKKAWLSVVIEIVVEIFLTSFKKGTTPDQPNQAKH